MSCPHSRIGDPSRCSQCLGAIARRVSNDGADVLIDGVPTGRVLNIESEGAATFYGKRGKAQSMRVTRRKGT